MAPSTAALRPASFGTFGELLRYLRRRQRLTQTELAIAVGYSTAQISRLEQNLRRPNPSTLQALFIPALGLQDQPEWAARLVELAQAADRLDLAAAPDVPSTFLFTDIEGSTQLWERHPDAMGRALARHDAILHQAVEKQRGVVVKSIGDGVHAVFSSASDAMLAAVAAQRALQLEPWGELGPLCVRMALHTGVAEERDGDYFGPTLNLAARLLTVGYGGQVLLSQVTQALLREQLPHDVELRDLGIHSLKGLMNPEQIFQLVVSGLPSEFPPLHTVAPAATNRPPPATPLLTTKLYMPPPRSNMVPRRRLIARLQAGSSAKLTLLTAPAGFGKTTLVSEWLASRSSELNPWCVSGQGLQHLVHKDLLAANRHANAVTIPDMRHIAYAATMPRTMLMCPYDVVEPSCLEPGRSRLHQPARREMQLANVQVLGLHFGVDLLAHPGSQGYDSSGGSCYRQVWWSPQPPQ